MPSYRRSSSPIPNRKTIITSHHDSSCEFCNGYRRFVDNLHGIPNYHKIRIRGIKEVTLKGFISGHLIMKNSNLERFDAFVNEIINKFQKNLDVQDNNPFIGVTRF